MRFYFFLILIVSCNNTIPNKKNPDGPSLYCVVIVKKVDELIASPSVTEAIEDMRVSLESFKSILLKVDDSNIKEAIDAGYHALDSLSKTLDKTSRVMEPNSPIQYNLIELTNEFEETARAIRSLIETLERNPQELIFGKDQNKKGE